MLGLCEITSCRRQALLRYFGDELPEPCGNCDTCLEPVASFDGTEAAQKALGLSRSGFYKMLGKPREQLGVLMRETSTS